jgi:hypothetical protein
MLTHRRRLVAGLVVLAVWCAVWAPAATAHPRDPAARVNERLAVPVAPGAGFLITPVVEAAPATPPPIDHPADRALSVAAMLALLLVAGGSLRCLGPTVRGGLAALLLVTSIESAIHSVHHLDNPRAGASCPILTVTQQLHADTSPPTPTGLPTLVFHAYGAPVPFEVAPKTLRRQDESRAPPRLLA